MKKILIIILFMLEFNNNLFSNINTMNPKMTDSELRKNILGIWFRKANFEGNYSFYGETFYKNDGTEETIAQLCNGDKCNEMHSTANWKIENKKLIIVFTSSNVNSIPVGHETIDEIIDLCDTTLSLKSGDGKSYSNFRTKVSKFF